jgi:intracellular septation protein
VTLNPHLKFVLDIIPIAVFFAAYKLYDLFTATAALLCMTLLVVAVIYWFERRIALAPLITAIVVAIFGGLTLFFHEERFIKIKPTLVNFIFATILLGGCWFGKRGLLRHVLGAALHLTERGWYLLSLRWGIFFLSMAGLNEIVWRNFPTSTWVNFKVFGLIGLTLLFAVLQAGLVQKHQIEEADAAAEGKS